MAESHAAVAHQFDDLAQQHEAATLGMWLFLVTEVMFFGGLFLVYLAYRFGYPQAFAEASHHLDVTLGAINTAVLIGSSLTMALAVHAAQTGRLGGLGAGLTATMLLGGVFLGIKAVEYSHKFHEGLLPGPGFVFPGPHAPQARLFFSLYFTMTGVHALHLVIGVGVLGVLLARALRRRAVPAYPATIELAGLYWHFVDVVWIFLFPLLYLIGGR